MQQASQQNLHFVLRLLEKFRNDFIFAELSQYLLH